MTHAQRVLAALRAAGPLDDDQLSTATGIAPRQQVNLICRKLADLGKISRLKLGSGKIVNEVIGSSAQVQADPEGKPLLRTTFRGTHDIEHLPSSCVSETLLIIACSGSKREGGRPDTT